jgi:hypothetical protein
MRVPSRPRTASLASRGSSISTNAKPANHKKEIILGASLVTGAVLFLTKNSETPRKQTYNRHNSGNLLNLFINKSFTVHYKKRRTVFTILCLIIQEIKNQSCGVRVELKTDDRFKIYTMYFGCGPASIWLSLGTDQEAKALQKIIIFYFLNLHTSAFTDTGTR